MFTIVLHCGFQFLLAFFNKWSWLFLWAEKKWSIEIIPTGGAFFHAHSLRANAGAFCPPWSAIFHTCMAAWALSWSVPVSPQAPVTVNTHAWAQNSYTTMQMKCILASIRNAIQGSHVSWDKRRGEEKEVLIVPLGKNEWRGQFLSLRQSGGVKAHWMCQDPWVPRTCTCFPVLFCYTHLWTGMTRLFS